MSWPFKPPPIERLLEEQLYEAQRQLILFDTAAEQQTTMADMFRRRIARIQGELARLVPPVATPHPVEPAFHDTERSP